VNVLRAENEMLRDKCLTCEGAGAVTVNFSVQSRGPLGIKTCPACGGTGETTPKEAA
jgi:DnaJ-class molecular chaperone